jgi:hypothetical protein
VVRPARSRVPTEAGRPAFSAGTPLTAPRSTESMRTRQRAINDNTPSGWGNEAVLPRCLPRFTTHDLERNGTVLPVLPFEVLYEGAHVFEAENLRGAVVNAT